MVFQSEESVRRNSESEAGDAETPEHDPHYEPIVSLPLVDVHTNEEDEEELVKIRSRLYRYDTADHEWKVCSVCCPCQCIRRLHTSFSSAEQLLEAITQLLLNFMARMG